MLTWQMIVNMNMSGDKNLEQMQKDVREALDSDGDPGPAVALALVRLSTERRRTQNNLEDMAVYIIELETRLVEAGFRFDSAQTKLSEILSE